MFFVENLIGAGITDWVIKRETGEQFYTIMLNPRLFHISAKTWLEYRANSMFSIANQKLPEIFASLTHRPFVSLYACLSWAEDYADFASFHYLQTMSKTPLRLQLKKGKETIVNITPLNTSTSQKRL